MVLSHDSSFINQGDTLMNGHCAWHNASNWDQYAYLTKREKFNKEDNWANLKSSANLIEKVIEMAQI